MKATCHKMLYGHYLHQKNQNISATCVAESILRRDHPAFLDEARSRWEALERKRGIKCDASEREEKKQKMLEGEASQAQSTFAAGKERPWHFMAAEEKNARREKCQAQWDLAFAVCGISYQTADHPVFREALQLSRAIPDFKLSCSKTMRTSRLDKLNESANKFKESRMKAGMQFGFLITSDGWRSVAKRNYHNYILLSSEGPIFLELEEATGKSATGESVAEGFKRIFQKLGADVTGAILLGVTDTPSANRKAWRLLEAEFPKQMWIGCATHEVALLFKEWVKKIEEIHNLFKRGLRIVKWVNNHSEILKLYREIVPSHFDDKRKHCLTLYMPGDTRFITVFKMLQRIQVLWPVLSDMVNRAEYETASQRALKSWSDSQDVTNKLKMVNGKFPDAVQHTLRAQSFLSEIQMFVNATKSTVFLLRLVDGQTPVIGKFYYGCALVDKHLRVLEEGGAVPYIGQLRSIFAKRWKRWHRPIHTFAYALDPCYKEHVLTDHEKTECYQVIKTIGGSSWPALKLEFNRWRNEGGDTLFQEEIWDQADKVHGFEWWDSFGFEQFDHLPRLASKVLSKAISASACEFNWSDVGQVELVVVAIAIRIPCLRVP